MSVIRFKIQIRNQKSEMGSIFADHKAAEKMDYACAWFKKAFDYIRDSKSEVGFV